MVRTRSVVLLSVLLAGVCVAPASSQPTSYTFVISYFEETQGTLAKMGPDGTLAHLRDYQVGADCLWVEASPNGQAALFGARYSSPQVTALFFDRSQSEAVADYVTLTPSTSGGPLAFHSRLPLLYQGSSPCRLMALDYPRTKLLDLVTSFPMRTSPAQTVFSPYCDSLLWGAPIVNWVEAVLTAADGSFTTETYRLDISPGRTEADMAISPNGRWVAALGGNPSKLSIIQLAPNGGLSLVQQLVFQFPDFYSCYLVEYTPSGKFLILTKWGGTTRLVSYRVAEGDGTLTEVNRLQAPGWDLPQAIAITPDGRYAVVMSPDILGGNPTVLHVVHIHEDGTLEWLQDKDTLVYGFPSDMEFVPPWRETYPGPQGMVVH